MKKSGKIIVSVVSLLLVAAITTLCLTFCHKKEEPIYSIINVDLNPSIEFIVDQHGLVVSANANNEEGNLILNGKVFVGKNQEDALELFIDGCKEFGYLSKHKSGIPGGAIKLSFSGKNADAMFDKLGTKVTNLLSAKDLDGTVSKGLNIGLDAITNLLTKCETYLSQDALSGTSEQDMMRKILQSREETKTMYSNSLKEYYYEAKGHEVKKELVKEAKENLSLLGKIAVDALTVVYQPTVFTLNTTKYLLFVKETSAYQLGLDTFRNCKAKYLRCKNYYVSKTEGQTENTKTVLDSLENLLNKAESTLAELYDDAMGSFSVALNAVNKAYTACIDKIKEFDSKFTDKISSLNDNLKTKAKDFSNDFLDKHKSDINRAKENWGNMSSLIKSDYVEE